MNILRIRIKRRRTRPRLLTNHLKGQRPAGKAVLPLPALYFERLPSIYRIGKMVMVQSTDTRIKRKAGSQDILNMVL